MHVPVGLSRTPAEHPYDSVVEVPLEYALSSVHVTLHEAPSTRVPRPTHVPDACDESNAGTVQAPRESK